MHVLASRVVDRQDARGLEGIDMQKRNPVGQFYPKDCSADR